MSLKYWLSYAYKYYSRYGHDHWKFIGKCTQEKGRKLPVRHLVITRGINRGDATTPCF